MSEKNKLLKSMGFDSYSPPAFRVDIFGIGTRWFYFDFSAARSEPDAILYTVIKQVWEEAYAKGIRDTQDQVRLALGLNEWLKAATENH